jgi:hypothetical protein
MVHPPALNLLGQDVSAQGLRSERCNHFATCSAAQMDFVYTGCD